MRFHRMDDLDRRNAILAAKIMGEFGASIAAPAVLAAWAGKTLDGLYGTGHRFLFSLLALALVATAVHLTGRAKAYGQEYEETNRTEPPEQPPQKR
jgi:hypothetical protein